MFLGNQANSEGGSLFLYNFGYFINKKKKILILFQDSDQNIQIKDCKFIDNSAKKSGGAIYIAFQLPHIDTSNIFKTNKAEYGKNIASFPIRMGLSVYKEDKTLLFNSRTKSSSLYLIKNEYPGIDLHLLLKIEVLDHFGQKINNLQNELFFLNLYIY